MSTVGNEEMGGANGMSEVMKNSSRTRSRSVHMLYVSHALSCWGDRMWEFAVALFFMKISPSSIVLVSLYGFAESLAVTCFGSAVGRWVDLNPRLHVAKSALIIQNGSVALTSLFITILLLRCRDGESTSSFCWSFGFVCLVILTNAFGGLSALFSVAGNIVVEKDWVVALVEDAEKNRIQDIQLSSLNSTMRRIDLICKLMAPILVGEFMELWPAEYVSVLISAWNLVSLGLEYLLLHVVYHSIPSLAEKVVDEIGMNVRSSSSLECQKYPRVSTIEEEKEEDSFVTWVPQSNQADSDLLLGRQEKTPEAHQHISCKMGEGDSSTVSSSPPWTLGILIIPRIVSARSWFRIESRSASEFLESWQIYARQSTFLAGLALALLYLTVLSFGSLMTAELQWRGFSPLSLSLFRSLAAIFGILGTLILPRLESKLGAVRSGLWAIWLQWSSLLPCFIAAVLPQFRMRLGSLLLVSGVVISRTGLWMFDLAVTQIVQSSVGESERGRVAGVQGALQEAFGLLSFALGVMVSKPQDFWILVLVSFASISLAAQLYCRFCVQERGHLIHWPKLLWRS